MIAGVYDKNTTMIVLKLMIN